MCGLGCSVSYEGSQRLQATSIQEYNQVETEWLNSCIISGTWLHHGVWEAPCLEFRFGAQDCLGLDFCVWAIGVVVSSLALNFKPENRSSTATYNPKP